ncbi:MAG: hypothetical protein RI531_07710, partial [Haloferacaceae archaeon]|nr:hypothetical protein [Haloferacaceae archaeon]
MQIPAGAITTAGDAHRLTIDSANFDAQEVTIDVDHATRAALSISVGPSGADPDTVITPAPAVVVADTYGNPVDAEEVGVTVDGGRTLNGTTSVATDATGTATFDDLTLAEAGSFSLSFTLGSDPAITTTSKPFLRVAQDGSTQHASIGAAVANATEGNTIVVEAGTYSESVTLDRNVTIEADGAVTISPPAGEEGGVGIELQSADGSPVEAVVDGITVDGFDTAVRGDDAGAWTARDVHIANATTGIDASGSGGDWRVVGLTTDAVAGTTVDASASAGNWSVTDTVVANATGTVVDAAGATGSWSLADTSIPDATAAVAIDAGTGGAAGGDWSVENVSVSGAATAVAAQTDTGGTGGNWSVADATLTDVGTGVDATAADGAWAVSGSTVRNATTGVAAGDSSGAWRVDATTVQNTTTGIAATNASGDWAVETVTLTDAETAIDAASTSGAWAVSDATVTDATTGVSAAGAAGTWQVAASTVTNATTGVDAAGTSGAWTLEETTFTGPTAATGSVTAVAAGGSTGDWSVRGTTITDASSTAGSVTAVATTDGTGSSGNWSVLASTITGLQSTTGDVRAIDARDATGTWTVGGPETTGTDTTGLSGEMRIADLQSDAAGGSAGAVDATGATGGWTVGDTTIEDVTTTAATADTESYAVRAGGATEAWTIEETDIRRVVANETAAAAIAIDAGDGQATSNWTVSGGAIADIDGSTATVVRDRTSGAAHSPTVSGVTIADVTARSGPGASAALDFAGTSGGFVIEDVSLSQVTNATGLDASDTGADWRFSRSGMADVSGTAISATASTGDWVVAFTEVSDVTDGVSADDSEGDWAVSRARFTNTTETVLRATGTRGNWQLTDSQVENASGTDPVRRDSDEDRGSIVVNATDAGVRTDADRLLQTPPTAGRIDGQAIAASVRAKADRSQLERVEVRTETSVEAETAAERGVRVRLERPVDGEDPRGARYDLTPSNVTAADTLVVNSTVVGERPRVVVANAESVSWTRTQNADGSWDISVDANPTTVDYHFAEDGSAPQLETEIGAATVSTAAGMSIEALTLSDQPAETQELLDGTVFMTDAQLFSAPQYSDAGTPDDTSDDYIQMTLSAPSTRTDATQNTGFYTVRLPEELIDHWGVSLEELQGLRNFEDTETTVTADGEGGAIMDVRFEYSTVNIAIGPGDGDGAPEGGEQEGSGEGGTGEVPEPGTEAPEEPAPAPDAGGSDGGSGGGDARIPHEAERPHDRHRERAQAD